MALQTSWEIGTLDWYQGGETIRDRLSVVRPEDASYVTTGHTASMTLYQRGDAVPHVEYNLNFVDAALVTVDATPNVLVARFDLIVSPVQLSGLTAGRAYDFAVRMRDSRNEVQTVERGVVHVGRAA